MVSGIAGITVYDDLGPSIRLVVIPQSLYVFYPTFSYIPNFNTVFPFSSCVWQRYKWWCLDPTAFRKRGQKGTQVDAAFVSYYRSHLTEDWILASFSSSSRNCTCSVQQQSSWICMSGSASWTAFAFWHTVKSVWVTPHWDGSHAFLFPYQWLPTRWSSTVSSCGSIDQAIHEGRLYHLIEPVTRPWMVSINSRGAGPKAESYVLTTDLSTNCRLDLAKAFLPPVSYQPIRWLACMQSINLKF